MVQNVKFISGDATNEYAFISSAGTGECLLWETSNSVLNPQGAKIEEVLQPAKILDIESSENVSFVSG